MTDRDYWKPQATLIVAAFLVFCLAALELWRTAGAWTRRSVLAALVLIAVGFGLLWSAATIEQWCASPVAAWTVTAGEGGLTWNTHSWHEPSLADCLRR